MGKQDLEAEIKDVNLLILLLIQRVARSSIEDVMIRFGLSRNEAEDFAKMKFEDMRRRSSQKVMLLKPRFRLIPTSDVDDVRDMVKEIARL